jgi:hypothetical protein
MSLKTMHEADLREEIFVRDLIVVCIMTQNKVVKIQVTRLQSILRLLDEARLNTKVKKL